MANNSSVQEFPLPADLPAPPESQRSAAIHLGGHPLPPLIELPSTSGGYVDLFLLSLKRPILLFIYPRTASPGESVPDSWNAIPGARGCTPHLCSVRDSIVALNAREPTLAIFGLSVQSNDVQQEAAKRLHLPFPLLSDAKGQLRKALDLPTFDWQGTTYLSRTTLLLREGQVTQFQHPVFPPTQAAQEALKMLEVGQQQSTSTVDASAAPAETPAAAPAATKSEMPSSEACVEERIEVLFEKIQSIENQQRNVATTAIGSKSIKEAPPKPRDLTGSIRSFKRLLQASSTSGGRGSSDNAQSADWRNSLVAVDNESGEVVGILAHNVTLSRNSKLDATSEHNLRPTAAAVVASPFSDEENDEIPTPPAGQRLTPTQNTYFDPHRSKNLEKEQSNAQQILALDTHAAHGVYRDPDVRPVSRQGSVLGEETFAPPPVPDKPQFLRVARPVKAGRANGGTRTSVRSSTASMPFHTANEMEATSADENGTHTGDEDVLSDGEAIDGLVRMHVKHVEAHRPDLLRDGLEGDDDGMASDASGSTIGGPAIQLWRKARGGRKGEAKRKAKRDAKAAALEAAAANADDYIVQAANIRRRDASGRASDASVRTSRAETAQEGDVESGGEEEESEDEEVQQTSNAVEHKEAQFQHPSVETVNVARAHRLRRDHLGTSQIISIEDRVWQSALEAGSLPVDAPYTHLAAFAMGNHAARSLQTGKIALEEASDVITGDEESGLELTAKGQAPRHKKAYDAKRTAASGGGTVAPAVMQGNSVLIEFLAGSRIAASVIHGAASSLMNVQDDARESSVVTALRNAPDAFSPTNLDHIPQTGAFRYIPVLPSHLLWFFGLDVNDEDKNAKQLSSDTKAIRAPVQTQSMLDLSASLSKGNVAAMGGDLLRFTSAAPSRIMEVATRSASHAWSGVTSWLGDAVQHYSFWRSDGDSIAKASGGYSHDDLLDAMSPGDEDADEWEWSVPAMTNDSLGNTPRPVYRRKRPVPSLYGGFQVRQLQDDALQPLPIGDLTIQRANTSNRYSIVHFDHEGIGRHAVLSAGMPK